MFETLIRQGSASPQEFVRAFAQEYPTPNVQRALALCEDGSLGWEQVARLFGQSLAQTN